jgi:hypothetical protein
MTIIHFRAAAILSMALGALGLAASFAGESGLPASLQEHIDQQRNAELSVSDWVLLAIGLPLVIAWMVSFVGMLRFSRWSRPLAVATSAMSILLLPLLGPTVEPSIATALNYASGMLYGAVLALAYYSPAATWFQAPPPPRKPQHPTSAAGAPT